MDKRQNSENLKIILFPFMAHGHMIPALDVAKLFATRGAHPTILTTPLNAPFFLNSIQGSRVFENRVQIKIVRFPSQEAGLPDGLENVDPIIENYKDQDILTNFILATKMMKGDFEKVLEETRPNCVVTDRLFPWTTESAAKYDVPRLVFHGSSFFAMCADECVRLHEPQNRVSSDSEPFVLPNLPGDIILTRNQLPEWMRTEKEREEEENEMGRFFKEAIEEETKSYGVIFNSFYELESTYADFHRTELKRRAWHIGPVSLVNKETQEKAGRGRKSTIDEHECLKWLDLRKTGSVIYVCFGSTVNFSNEQLIEIAVGLERSGQDFIWVVRKENKKEEKECWLPDGFEDRTKEGGLIIHGWAPQVLILGHQAIGGFVTHCGWNSVLEGVSAGVPMVTWPVLADQFYNQILVTRMLKSGIPVGVEKLVMVVGDFVGRKKVEKAVRELMGAGEEAEERRRRAKVLAEIAGRAVEQGGSSHSDLTCLMDELMKSRGG